jgi:hypothetical protein
MGIASSGFNDPAYGITKAGDGYIFVSAPPGTGGNLVLATADGSHLVILCLPPMDLYQAQNKDAL